MVENARRDEATTVTQIARVSLLLLRDGDRRYT